MKIKAKISFCGALTMAKDEERDIRGTDESSPQRGLKNCSSEDSKVVDDLIEAGYVEVVEEEKQVQNENKRGKPKSD